MTPDQLPAHIREHNRTVERDDLRAAHERLDRNARAVAGRSLHYEALAEATRLADEVERLRRIERAEVADLKFDVERLEKAVDVLAASVNAATIRAEKAEAEVAALRAERDRWRRIAMDHADVLLEIANRAEEGCA